MFEHQRKKCDMIKGQKILEENNALTLRSVQRTRTLYKNTNSFSATYYMNNQTFHQGFPTSEGRTQHIQVTPTNSRYIPFF